MRSTTIKIGLAVSIYSINGLALDLTKFENQCAEIGFKGGTPAFGSCVLELHSREANPNSNQKFNQQLSPQVSSQNALAREALEVARRAREEVATARREADEYRKMIEAQRRRDRSDEADRRFWESNQKAMNESWQRP